MNRVNQVLIALIGYQPEDRVTVYRDTKSNLGIFSNRGSGYPLRNPQPGVILEGPLDQGRFPVLFDNHPRKNDKGDGWWWVHPDDMRPE